MIIAIIYFSILALLLAGWALTAWIETFENPEKFYVIAFCAALAGILTVVLTVK